MDQKRISQIRRGKGTNAEEEGKRYSAKSSGQKRWQL